ncbi:MULTISPECIES: CRISPR system precrRNA processing endoribonuclease RAMP protein Cas6 [Salinibaculum]|uniref:CRISPR system precrRNA processing endoribonuclease RAMP protein Cas6 n=1 Tax=Salinibaculum TaxID=2732368 RepID=UPI0030CF2F14
MTLTLVPSSGTFPVPFSTGYQTYSGLLSLLSNVDTEVADEIHGANFSSLTNSGLLGDFGYGADRPYHKQVYGNQEYRLRLGVTHPDDEALFEALVRAFVINDRSLPLAHGELTVESVESETTEQETVLTTAHDLTEADLGGVRVSFETPTCRQRYGEVWETHPQRTTLFPHLADRWNALADTPDIEMMPVAETLGEELYTVPDADAYDTHSIVVYREEPPMDEESTETDDVASDGGQHLNEAQGYTGTWTFRFKGASEATKTAVLALSRFAEFSGVGRHTARGAGTVSVEIVGCDNAF